MLKITSVFLQKGQPAKVPGHEERHISPYNFFEESRRTTTMLSRTCPATSAGNDSYKLPVFSFGISSDPSQNLAHPIDRDVID